MAKKKRKVGRPSKYNPLYCQKIIDFFSQESYEDIELPHYKDGEIKWKDFKRVSRPLPTLIQFAKSLKLNYCTVYDWTQENSPRFQPNFSQALMRAKELQKDILIQGGLAGAYNPLFAKFVAVNITDMRDKTETELSGEIKVMETIKIDNQKLEINIGK